MREHARHPATVASSLPAGGPRSAFAPPVRTCATLHFRDRLLLALAEAETAPGTAPQPPPTRPQRPSQRRSAPLAGSAAAAAAPTAPAAAVSRPSDPPPLLEYANAWETGGPYDESTTGTARLLVHYIDAAAWPAHPDRATASFAAQVLAVAEECLRRQNDELGWALPPSDLAQENNGGDARYDIYLSNLGGLATPLFGYVLPGGVLAASSPSYMVLDNDFADPAFGGAPPQELLRVTFAHEYNHSCQYAYAYGDAERWFYEATAVWMEQRVYPAIPDYLRYLPGRMAAPQVSLRAWDVSIANTYSYGAAMWNHYLATRFGDDLIREVWAGAGETSTTLPRFSPTLPDSPAPLGLLASLGSTLAGRGSSLAGEAGRYSAALWWAGSRWPEGEAGAAAAHELGMPSFAHTWPALSGPAVHRTSTPNLKGPPLAAPPQRLGSNVFVLEPATPLEPGRVRFVFQGFSTEPWRLWQLTRTWDGAVAFREVALDPAQTATINVPDAPAYASIAFVATNVSLQTPISVTGNVNYQWLFLSESSPDTSSFLLR